MKFNPTIGCWTKFWLTKTDLQASCRALLCSLVLVFGLVGSAQANCIVSCKLNLSISLGPAGEAVLTPLILLQDPSCDPADFTVQITDPQGNNVGNTLTCDHIGLTMIATVIQTATGNSCSTTIFVGDQIRPEITCVDTTIMCIQSSDPQVIGYPTVTDNCDQMNTSDLTYSDEIMDLGCFTLVNGDTITGWIKRLWSATDSYGNTDTCTQNIYLKRATLADVDFPPHRDGFAAPALDCGDDPNDLNLTGRPSVAGLPLDNAGYCELVISSSDQVIPSCGSGGYKVLRTWTVIDYCADEFDISVQVIKVEDTTPPVLSCPADFTVGTSTNSCDASVILPQTTATDDCSTWTITPSWAFGSGYGPFNEVPVGSYTVTYTATDACGNESTCEMTLHVVDDVAPTPVCDGFTTINLNYQGSGYANASSFENGSHDNCGVASIEVSRDGINYGPQVYFDCADVDQGLIPVHLRVTDVAGNFNECTVYADINDMVSPALTCPPDITLECTQDYTDLFLTGSPLYSDNCGVDTVTYVDSLMLNDCGVGQILRFWTVADHAGNSVSCVQALEIVDNTPISVTFPADFATTGCVTEIDTTISGAPIVQNADCEDVTVIYTDQIVGGGNSCYHILRTWQVYEWCAFDPNINPSPGLWTDVQFIEVQDETAPILAVPSTAIVGMLADDCAGTYVDLAPATATDCDPNVTITNNSLYADAGGADASGFYPPGVYLIHFTATDGCNNSTTASVIINVVDAKAPVASCTGGVNVELMEDGTVSIPASVINNGSYDNCTASADLQISISPSTFTCDDVGEQQVTLTVTDAAGNSATCITTVNIQSNNLACGNQNQMLMGATFKESGQAMSGVEVELSSNGILMDATATDNFGIFTFPEVPTGNDYTITPYKNVNTINGVSTFDLLLIQQHILGIQEFTSPYDMIAGDINHSGNISGFDIVMLRRLILQIDTSYLYNTSWRFVDANYEFPNGVNPLSVDFPESITLNNLQEDVNTLEFIGVKIGDITGNASPGLTTNGASLFNEDENLRLEMPRQTLQAGETYHIPVSTRDLSAVLGYQFALSFDPELIEIQGVEPGDLEGMTLDNFNLTALEQGLLTTSWTRSASAGEPDEETDLFYLKIRALETGDLTDMLQLGDQLQAEAYNERLQIIDLTLELTETNTEVPIGDTQVATLLQNSPNPMGVETTIRYFLPEDQAVQLSIYDANGRQVYREEKTAVAGWQEMRVQRTDLPVAGLYWYCLQLENGTILTKQMVVQ